MMVGFEPALKFNYAMRSFITIDVLKMRVLGSILLHTLMQR